MAQKIILFNSFTEQVIDSMRYFCQNSIDIPQGNKTNYLDLCGTTEDIRQPKQF